MKWESYLITTWIGNRSRSFVWNGHEPVALDHPAKWMIEKTSSGVWIHDITRDTTDATNGAFEIPPQLPPHGVDLALRAVQGIEKPGYTRRLNVNVRKLQPIRAAFLPNTSQGGLIGQSDLFLYSGVRYFLSSSHKAGNSYVAKIGGKAIFKYLRTAQGYSFMAYVPGLRIKLAGEKRRALQVGASETIPEAKLLQSTLIWNKYWWRLNRIATAPPLPDFGEDDPLLQEEKEGIRKLSIGVTAAILVLMLAPVFFPKAPERKPAAQPITVNLKPPKIIPVKPVPPPPPPPVIAQVKPPEPPKPKPKPPEPERKPPKPKPPEKKKLEVVKKPPPPAKKPVHVVKREAPAPKVVARVQPPTPAPPPPKPIPVPVTPLPPDPAIARAQAEARARTVAAAQAVAEAKAKAEAQAHAKAEAQATLAKSLGFLSPSANRAAVKVPVEANNAGKYDTLNAGADAKKLNSNVLGKMAGGGGTDGPIDTKSSRSIASNVSGLGRSKGKGFNEVQGRVSVAALYDPNAKGDFGDSLSSKSFSLSGPGHIDESAIEKALSKHLQKFQYCYEKSLLGNPNLSGTVLMQWNITLSGGADGIKVVRSQLNDASLHNCLARELGRIKFPSPTGGAVMIKYPFAFSASSI